jgi:predicted ATPase
MELNFLADLASDRRLRHSSFVILGAYRDNEVGEQHPLQIALEMMKAGGVRLYTIDVLPFTQHEMRELLIEVIGWTGEHADQLSELAGFLFEKAQGNLIFYLEVGLFLSLLTGSLSTCFIKRISFDSML